MTEDCKVDFEKWVTATPSDMWRLVEVESKSENKKDEIIAHNWSDNIDFFCDALDKLMDDADWGELFYSSNIGEHLNDSWFLFIFPGVTYRLFPIADMIYYTNYEIKEVK